MTTSRSSTRRVPIALVALGTVPVAERAIRKRSRRPPPAVPVQPGPLGRERQAAAHAGDVVPG